MFFMLLRPEKPNSEKKTEENVKLQAQNCKKDREKKSPRCVLYVEDHMTFDTVTRIIETAAEEGGGNPDGAM